MGKNKNNSNHTFENQNFEHFKMEPNIGKSIYYMRNQCIEIQKTCKRFLDEAKVYDKINSLMKFMLSNPLLLVGFIIITATLLLPIVLFTIFAIINVAIAFTCFIIIEVTLLMIGITVLCCVIFLIISAVIVTGISFILTFYVVYFSFELVKRKIQHK